MPKHNFLFGHLLILKRHMERLPRDCTTNTTFLEISKEFPAGVFYIDLWPIARSMLVVNTIHTVTQLQNATLDKPPQLDSAFHDLCGGLNLFTLHERPWKYWRRLFNPGFSPSHMLELVPAIVTETEVFCDILRQHAATSGIIQLENVTIKLTIGIICAVSL
jgi:cytochrome P450